MSVLRIDQAQPVVARRLLAVGNKAGQLAYQLVHLAVEFDESGEWADDGDRSAAHWIARRLDLEICTAREWIRIGNRLRYLTAIDKAWQSGRLSYSKVRALVRVAKKDNEAEMLRIATRVPAGSLSTALAQWSVRNEDQAVIEERQRAHRALRWRTGPDGSVWGSFTLEPVAGGQFAAAIDGFVRARPQRVSADARREDKSHASLVQMRADALVDSVCKGGSRVSTELIVHVRGDGNTLDDGTPVTDNKVASLLPGSFVRALIHDAESRPIDCSGRRRFPTKRQRRVVRERDGRCVDCGSTDFLEYDHNPVYAKTNRTQIDELELRCSKCHRCRHDGS